MPNLSNAAPWPTTLSAAVDRFSTELSAEERAKLAAMAETTLDHLNSGLGARIRKRCGLWQGNAALMRSCDAENPEDTSLAILRALWVRLREP